MGSKAAVERGHWSRRLWQRFSDLPGHDDFEVRSFTVMFASLTFLGSHWILPIGVILGLALALMAWSYRVGPAGWVRWLCLLLKTLGLAALAFCLLEPLWTGQRAKPGANLFAVLADNSAGLQIADLGETQTRGERLKQQLDPNASTWQDELAENFEVRRFTFDARLNATRDFAELNFAGMASRLGGALRGITDRFQGLPLAGVLLFTDGNATDPGESLADLKGLPPVYPVLVGKEGRTRDLAIAQVNVSQTAFEDAPVSVQASVEATGLAGERVVGQLLDASGKKVAEEIQRAGRAQELLPFRFRWRPDQPGLSFYRLRVGLSREIQGATNGAATQEATLANNERVIAVDRGRGPYRVLYVSGRPNWEFKFLNRAEQEDDQIELVGLMRVARREPKFEYRGRAGETSNPLYRGFGNQSAEDLERYDQPVLVRLNTRDELELRNGFPRKAEDLYGYRAVILDDVEAAFFSPDQAALLQKFVSERGGGFLMLGGMECFRQGGYHRTPIGDMLPVYLDRAQAKPPQDLRLALSREGWLQAWMRLRDNESDERARWQAMPAFEVFNATREVKPGASVLASATDATGRDYPALVTQRFGRGRSAALMVGDVWRWGMQGAEARRDMEKSWRQLVRWLISDVPPAVEIAAEPPAGDLAGAVQLQVRVRNKKFQPLDDATVSINVESALGGARADGTNGIRLRAEASANEAGVYEATFVPHETGGFRATATVLSGTGAEIGRAETGWSTDLAAEEFRSLQPNRARLETIAARTGGGMIAESKLAEFVRSLPSRRSPVMEAWTIPAWHTPALFGLALACLVLEWGLRRWKGMA